jgi:hypothetical protein
MSKRLVFLFCLLLAVVFVAPAFAEVQNVKVSGDILARYIGRNDFDLTKAQEAASSTTVNPNGNSGSLNVFNTVTRVRIDADLTDKVSTVVRLINERNWNSDNGSAASDIDLDLAYVTLKEFLYSPLTVTVGRQELHFGNDMIIGDGVGALALAGTAGSGILNSGGIGTNQFADSGEAPCYFEANGDLSARKSFDAVRATLNYDPLVVDIVYAKISSGFITGASRNDDVNLFGVNAGYRFSDKWNSMAEAYYWNKMNHDAKGSTGTSDSVETVYVLGGRVSTNPTKKINIQQEIAWQGGQKLATGLGSAVRDRNAWASQTMGYLTPGWKYEPTMGLIYSYFSGDASITSTGGDKKYRAWDPMFENQTAGHIINALFGQSNAHSYDLMMSMKPLEDVTFRADFVILQMAKGLSGTAGLPNQYTTGYTYLANKKDLGRELDMTLTYDYTEDVQLGLLAGWFFPGKALSNTTAAEYHSVASEVIASCKVSF